MPPGRFDKLRRLAGSILNPLAWINLVRLVHYYNYAHVQPRRRLTVGRRTRLSPLTSLRHAERIRIGNEVHFSEGCLLWAGPTHATITIGDFVLFGPGVMLTAANYDVSASPIPMAERPRLEAPIVIGNNVWLGARVVVVAGVTIGDGCVVGANAVVTRDLPAGAIAGGIPARVLDMRESALSSIA